MRAQPHPSLDAITCMVQLNNFFITGSRDGGVRCIRPHSPPITSCIPPLSPYPSAGHRKPASTSVLTSPGRWWRSHGRLECHAFMHDYRACCSASSVQQDMDALANLPPIPLIDQTHRLHGLFLEQALGPSREPTISSEGPPMSLAGAFPQGNALLQSLTQLPAAF